MATHWNIRVYEDDNCFPGNLLWEDISEPTFEYFVYCQAGTYPIFQYEFCFSFSDGPGRYWFGAQASDHVFPPQVGRVAAASVVECESYFRSDINGYPDWVPVGEVFAEYFDPSLEIEGTGGILDGCEPDWQACCIGDEGVCRTVRDSLECVAYGGEWHRDSYCLSDPCQVTPVLGTTWGRLKSLFR